MNIKDLFSMLLCLAILSVSSVAISSSGPTESLKPVLSDIMAILKDPNLAGDDQKDVRRTKIMEIAVQGFDFTEMSKRVLGQTWRTLSPDQREQFTRIFTKLLEHAYIGKLEGYSGQEIIYKGERIKGKKAAVSTVVQNKDMILPVNYVMLKKDSGWQVYDINIEGVSLIRNYREQFKSILRKDKFDGLIKVLEAKNTSFAGEGLQ